jgi:hypothetical protein
MPPTLPNEIKMGDDAPLPSPYTCAWAQLGLSKAMDGMMAAGSGASGYGIGTRWVRYKSAAEQQVAVDYWQRMVEQYCGCPPVPSVVTGRATARRVIMRDV